MESLGEEDSLEKGMAAHSSNSRLENPMDGGAWKATVRGITESDMTELLTHDTQGDERLYK